ncbi:MAG: hypothetical protein HYZ75_18615 [Elusimicrobia bacterium]|nr:hypothetical protein [Elusimicrobiota bacterium]
MTPAGALLAAAAAAAWGVPTVTHCPDSARPVRTVDSRTPWACVLSEERYQDGEDCPPGTRPVTTVEADSPFKCALNSVVLTAPRGVCPPGHLSVPSEDRSKEYACEKTGKGFMGGPSCPKGSRPVPTPGAMQSFKCVSGPPAGDPSPEATPAFEAPPVKTRSQAAAEAGAPAKGGVCPKGTRRVVTENPFSPVQCVPRDDGSPKRLSYKAFRRAGALAFEYPAGWNLTDGWSDAEPAVYVMLDRGRDGRPVSLSVTRARRATSGFVDMETRIWQEEDWHSAKELGRTRNAGSLTVRLEAPGEGRLTLVGAPDGYFALAYGAPAELFARYLPAFERLEKTFRNLETAGR